MELRRYAQEDIQGKRVVLRSDLDVSVNPEGVVDQYHDLRLERVVPTLSGLFSFGARQVVIMGHRGSPEGAAMPEYSLAPVCERLAELCRAEGLDEPITFIDDLGVEPTSHRDQDLIMLENLRFDPGEKAADSGFASRLARWGEVYVNDAFGSSHRGHASLVLVPRAMGQAFAGPALACEAEELESFLVGIKGPFVAVVGGAKISTKLPLLSLLAQRAQSILVGGALANTILASRGVSMGASLVEAAMLNKASELSGEAFILPGDAVAAGGKVVDIGAVSSNQAVLDIGPETIKLFVQRIGEAKTILWNGPLGAFEESAYARGSEEIARAIAKNRTSRTLAGGGETVELIERLGLIDRFGFVSAGGGAMLTFLVGGDMPGLEAVSL
ncbi:MAG: phosphoglycerate kinase [Parcubacteria group bacterium]|nr:phosphoglycerate kinase [Parcubacteria group bacterium]